MTVPSTSTRRLGARASGITLLACVCASFAACGNPPQEQLVAQQDAKAMSDNLGRASAHYFLSASDLEKFRAGRTKNDILADISWRGNFGCKVELDGNRVCSITYQLFSDDPDGEGGEVVRAVFVDDKFAKFVRWLPPLPDEMEVINHEGTPWSRPKPRRLSDLSSVARVVQAEPVDLVALEVDVKSRPAATTKIDPGLTAAFVLAGGLSLKASKEDLARNAHLRDQFNAARLDLGMSANEIGTILKAKPLYSAKYGTDNLKIYGSNESFNINPVVHFSNILILFHEGKARAIHGVKAGQYWLQELREQISDFPRE
jgi:hypothetical protein